MKKLKRVWVSEEAYKSAKVQSALEGLKLTSYLNKKLCDDSKEVLVKKKENKGYYGFIK